MDKSIQKVFNRGKSRIELNLRDCFEGMDAMPSECVDVVVTSPPYNLGIDYGVYNDKKDRQTYLDWLEDWSIRILRILSPNGSLFLNIGGKPSDPWVPMEVAFRLRKQFELQNLIHWIKSIAIERTSNGDDHGLMEDVNVGHIKPINSPRYLSDAHEHVFHFTKSGNVPLDRLAVGVAYKHKSNVTRWKSKQQDVRCRGNTWFIPYKTIMSRNKERPHPASFPPKLAEMCIKLHGHSKVNLVLDPFMGLGSTAEACKDLGVSCIGFEIDPDYFEYSCQRIEQSISAPAQENFLMQT
jgi:site-specific DNA-methyltransferase (adenine-specific)